MDNQDKTVSQIVITFQEPGNVNLNLDLKNVTPLQAVAAAWLLQKHAETGFFQQEMIKQQQAEASKIAVPGLQMKKPIIKI
jgi:hypothetical protein